MANAGYTLAFARNMVREKMAPYSAALPPIYARYGGFYLALGAPSRGVEHLAGTWGPRAVMLGQFPDYPATAGFWWGPEYRAASKLREGAVVVDACRFAGVAPSATVTALLLVALRPRRLPGFSAVAAAVSATIDRAELLAPQSSCEAERLEGDLAGYEVFLLGLPDADAARTAWSRMRAELDEFGEDLQCYLVNRTSKG